MGEYKEIQNTELIFAGTVGNTLIDCVDWAAKVYAEVSTTNGANPASARNLIENFRALFLYTSPYIKDKKAIKDAEDLFKIGTQNSIPEQKQQKPIWEPLPVETCDFVRHITESIYRHRLQNDFENRPREEKEKTESINQLVFDKSFTRGTVIKLLAVFEEYSKALHKSPLMNLIRETASIQEQ